jgi:hypothetical protein
MRRTRAIAFAAALVVTGGCALGDILGDYPETVAMTSDMLTGTWWADAHRLIRFSPSGRMAANDLPLSLVSDALPADFDRSSDGADVAGTWTALSDGVSMRAQVIAGSPADLPRFQISAYYDEHQRIGLFVRENTDVDPPNYAIYHKA